MGLLYTPPLGPYSKTKDLRPPPGNPGREVDRGAQKGATSRVGGRRFFKYGGLKGSRAAHELVTRDVTRELRGRCSTLGLQEGLRGNPWGLKVSAKACPVGR